MQLALAGMILALFCSLLIGGIKSIFKGFEGIVISVFVLIALSLISLFVSTTQRPFLGKNQRKLEKTQGSLDYSSFQASELQTHLDKAATLTTRGRIYEAIGIYTSLIEQDPSNALIYAYRGACYARTKEPNMAVKDLYRAIELDIKCAVAYYNLSVFYRTQGEFGKSRTFWERAISLDSKLVLQIHIRTI
jgi:Tetratricopeptide repeat.